MKRSTIIEVIVVLYAILFAYTGISKLIDYSVFREQLAESPILSAIAAIIATILPWTEFLLAVLLIVPQWRLHGLYAACILMTVFTLYIIAMLSFSDKLPCSCGGVISLLSWPQHIVFNTAFVLMAIAGIFLQKRQMKNDQEKMNPLY